MSSANNERKASARSDKVNKNIEVLREKLWSVRFQLLPYISEIGYQPGETLPAYTEPLQLMENGVVLLNKDHQNYKLIQDSFLNLMGKGHGWLKKKKKEGQKIPIKNKNQFFYYSLIDIEIARRKLSKKKR